MLSSQLREVADHADEGEAARVAPGKRTLTAMFPARAGGPPPAAPEAAASDRLPAEVQRQMGGAFGLHLADVPVDRASGFATALGADAVAHDGRLHFAPGMYDPASTAGLELIGHEVAHLAQQTDGRASMAQAKGEGESPELEAEADALGARAARGAVGLLGDGTPRTPARSAAVQRRPTRWADIDENGAGVVWAPHKTAAPGNRNQSGQARGTGATVDAPPPDIQYEPATVSGGRGVRATNLGRQVAPGAPPAVDPAAAFNQYGFGYVNAQLLPAAAGGIGDARNVIALPPDASGALAKIHQAIGALAQAGFVNVQILVDEAQDPSGLHYASQIRARWAQVGATGAEVVGTVGEYVANPRSPTQVHQGTGASNMHATFMFTPNQAVPAHPPVLAPDARRAELKTTIDFDPTTADGDAQGMHARVLGPDHGIGEQPASGQVWGQRTKALETASGNKMKYIAGHLLNHHLGGPGNDARNLAPIPDDVNHEHEAQVEDKVKTLVRGGQWVTYEVVVGYGVDPNNGANYPSQLSCRWAQLDGAGQPIASTEQRVVLPIAAPSTYGVTPPPPGKKLPKLATSLVTHQGLNAANPIGAHTTLGFDEVMLEDTGTLGPQIRVMKPLIAALAQLGLNAQFQHNGALAQDVFHAMAAVKPTVAECEARAAVEERTQALRDLTVTGDLTDAEDVIAELREQLDRFVNEAAGRADASRFAARGILDAQYEAPRADEFAAQILAVADRALRDLELTRQSAEVVIGFAEQLLRQHRQVAHLDHHPMSPNQALDTNLFEAEYNDEDVPDVGSGLEAESALRRRRLNNPGAMLFAPPERRHGADRLLETIDVLKRGHRRWPVVEGSGLSPAAQRVGQAIEGLVPGGPSTDAALDMVVRSLYQTNTVAFNEYAAWLAEELQRGQASSSQPAFDDPPFDLGGGFDEFDDTGLVGGGFGGSFGEEF